MNKNSVLSFSNDPESLIERALALRTCGFEVVSVGSETEARYEIQMGRCGNLLICSRTSPEATRELSDLFKRYCPEGCVVFVKNQNAEAPEAVDYVVSESEGPGAIVRALSDMGRSPVAKAS